MLILKKNVVGRGGCQVFSREHRVAVSVSDLETWHGMQNAFSKRHGGQLSISAAGWVKGCQSVDVDWLAFVCPRSQPFHGLDRCFR